MQTHETIRTRLLGQAAGRFNCRPENLAPETRLFIDWMAWELGTLHRQLAGSDDAIAQRLQRRLRPERQTRPLPAHAIAYAMPRQHNYLLRPGEDVFNLPRFGDSAPQSLFFAPLLPVPLLKARVKYLTGGNTLAEIAEPFYHHACLTAPQGAGLHPGELWLGIQVKEPLSAYQPLCFYLDWNAADPARSSELRRLQALIQWQHQEAPATASSGLWYDSAAADRHHSAYLDDEYLFLYGIEQDILRQFDPGFIQLQAANWQTTAPPPALQSLFGTEALEEQIKEPLLWLRLLFPAGCRPEEIGALTPQLNCFPILNRRLDKTRDFAPTGQGGIEITSLSNAGQGRAALHDMGTRFLGIQRIFSQHADYRPVSFQNFNSAEPGFYALQHGRLEADDYRDMYARMAELSDQIREHASTLKLLDQHTVNQALSSIESGAELLRAALRQSPAKDLDLGYYLHLKPLDAHDMIFVRFWLTQGEHARGIGSSGDRLMAVQGNTLESDTLWWVKGGAEQTTLSSVL